MKMRVLASFVFLMLFIGNANASTMVGGYTFDDNAFADTLIGSAGNFSTSGGSLTSALTDIDAGTYAFSWDTGAYVELGFTDNKVVNGSGADLVLFELGVPDELSVTLNGVTMSYMTSSTGHSAGGYSLNAVAIDLTDFGILADAFITDIFIGMDLQGGGQVPSLSLVGALNSKPVPIPAAVWLFGSGLLGLFGISRRKG